MGESMKNIIKNTTLREARCPITRPTSFSHSLTHLLTHSLSRRGQAAIEHAVLTAVLVAAVLGMAVVTKRAVMGRWRTVGDSFGSGRQYDPVKTSVR